MTLQCSLGPEDTIGVAIMYHPPSAKVNFTEEMCNILTTLSLRYMKSIVVGDIDCWADDPKDSEA